MRMELQTHPKVVRILSATSSDKFRVIGGLHAVWCVFDQHSQDGKLFGYTPDLLDHVIGWSGFSAALVAVGWLVFDGIETVEMPEFTEHNGQSAKRRAEDQKRKKNSRKCQQIVRNESDEEEDKKQTREEKRREDKKDSTKFDFKKSLIDGGVSESIASDYIATRKAKKCVQTETAFKGFASEALKAGLSLADAAALCCKRGWGGFDASWVKPEDAPKATVHQMPSFFAGAR